MTSVENVTLRRCGELVGSGRLTVYGDELSWAGSCGDNLRVSCQVGERSFDDDENCGHLTVALDEGAVVSFHFECEEDYWEIHDSLVGLSDELGWRGGAPEEFHQIPPEISVSVEPLTLQTHVTCLHFVRDDLLFAGVGGTLRAFAAPSSGGGDWSCVLSQRIFSQQSVHGLATRGSALVVFGGKSVSFLRFVQRKKLCRVGVAYSFPVEDWVLDCCWVPGRRQVWLLTANNALLCYDLRLTEPFLLSRDICSERCILYSGKVIPTRGTQATVLAGTVFSTIFVWSTAGPFNPKPVHCRISGHRGVIFSVNYCEATRRIVSTSDDRTVRVWDVEFPSEEEPSGDWSRVIVTPKLTLYGHSARVWTSRWAGQRRIVSVGEDSRICLWGCDGKLENQWSGHQGGEIWSADVFGDMVATGGSDGGISLWRLTNSPVPTSLPPLPGQTPRCAGLTRFGEAFLVTDNGHVLLHTNSSWQLYLSEPALASYSIHSVSPNRALLALGSISGLVLVCQLDQGAITKLLDFTPIQGRIFTLKWVQDHQLVICAAHGALTLWTVSVSSATSHESASHVLPPSKERWATCCGVYDKFLVCGDRSGSLFLYSSGNPDPVFRAHRIHGHNGVTDVKFLNGQLTSTGRDGTCREWILEDNQLTLLRTNKVNCNWAAAVFTDLTPKKILICFHEVFLLLWSLDERRTVLKLDCGGGHRSWDCTVHSNNLQLVYIKGKLVYFCSVPLSHIICPGVLMGGHPKAINAAAVIPQSSSKLLLLGGEDTTLRLVSLDSQRQISVVQSHLSSIRAVTCYYSSSRNCSFAASGGGRGQFVIRRVLNSAQVLEIVELCSYFIMSSSQHTKSNTLDTVDEAEMRIMDLTLAQQSKSSLTLCAGCSDGFIRLFTYTIDDGRIDHRSAINNNNCMLKLLFVDCAPNSLLLSADTNGKLCFFQLSETGEMNTDRCFSLGEVGLNSFDCQVVSSGCLIVGTGGDDAVVNIAVFTLTDQDWSLSQQWTSQTAHHCQVSGLVMTDKFVFTAGLDQSLSTFSWSLSNYQLNVSCIARTQLSIPDIHGSLVWRTDTDSYEVFVYGLGTQLLKVTVTSS